MSGRPYNISVPARPGGGLEQALAAAQDVQADAAVLAAELAALRHQVAEFRQAATTEGALLRQQAEELRAALARKDAALRDALGESEGQFRAAFDRSAIGMSLSDPESCRLLRVNARFCRISGYTEAELLGGMTFLDLTHPADRARDLRDIQAAVAAQEACTIETRCMRKDGAIIHVQVDCVPIEGGPGRPGRLHAVVQDITERRAAAERQALLAREVDHRAKNLLAVMQSIIRLTRAPDLKGYMRAIEGRIGAVARAHSLLAAERWRHALLRRLVQEELAPYGATAERVRCAGPDLLLLPEAVQALGMALHELATNAAKYGALSVPGGSLSITWEVAEAQDLLRLRWQEQGGPLVEPPGGRRGFGSRVIAATIEEQLGGQAAMAWEAAGLRCEIAIPLPRAIPGRRVQLPR